MSVTVRALRVVLVGATIGLVSPKVATAQVGAGAVGSIIGQVKDESGAVLPGVTVTATSPALQVQQLASVTNERGEYRLAPLPIGTYAVEYALSGFQTIRREDQRLTAGFVATIDIVLKVGSVAESVTVNAGSPVVDVTSTGPRTEFTQETLQLIPSGRNGLISLFNQTPSVRSNFDVGGSAGNDLVTMHVYGVDSESWTTLEGIVTTAQSGTQSGNYFDYNSFEEARAQTLGNEANVAARGVYVNLIVKSGGDTFHGDTAGAWTAVGLQSNNIDAALLQQGFIPGSAQLTKRWDASQDFGGPILPKRLWVFAAARDRDQNRNTLGFKPDGSPFTIDQTQTTGTLKLSYQMTPSNRLVGFYFIDHKVNIGGSLFTPFTSWESRSTNYYSSPMGKVEWQSVRGNSLVTSLQYSVWRWTSARPGDPNVGPASNDLTTQRVWGTYSLTNQTDGSWRTCSPFSQISDGCHPLLKGSVSWYRPNSFLGNHEVGAGFDYISNSNGTTQTPLPNGDYQLIYNNNVPFEFVTITAPVYPYATAIHTGVYVKDNWTNRRLTLNLGLRYGNDNGFVPAQCRAAGQFAAAGCTGLIQDTIWNSWSPRLYAAYDLTGDAKTVIKGGWGRFGSLRTTDEMSALNPLNRTLTTYRWHAPVGSTRYVPGQVNLDPNGSDFVSSTGASGVVNPNEKQPTEDEFEVSLERQLMANFGVSASGRYSRRFNIERREFINRPPSAWNIPITRIDPGPDGKLGTSDDGGPITYYAYPAALAGAANQLNMLVNDPRSETFATIEVAATKRLSNRWQLMASYSATKLNIPVPDGSDYTPNSEINTANETWEQQGRISGAYQAGAGITASVNFDHRGGLARARTALFTAAGTTVPSILLNVGPIGSLHDPDTNILDLGLDKTFKFGRQAVTGRMSLFNALNANTPTAPANSGVGAALNYQSGAAFLRPSTIVPPRIVEFTLTYRF
jgi:hypothetical protein